MKSRLDFGQMLDVNRWLRGRRVVSYSISNGKDTRAKIFLSNDYADLTKAQLDSFIAELARIRAEMDEL